MIVKYPPPELRRSYCKAEPCPIKNKSQNTFSNNLNLNNLTLGYSLFCLRVTFRQKASEFFLLLLSFSFILSASVTAQIKIKEKVEIKPTTKIIENKNLNSITSGHTIKVIFDWDSSGVTHKDLRAKILLISYGCNLDTVESAYGYNGHEESVNTNNSAEYFNIKIQTQGNNYPIDNSWFDFGIGGITSVFIDGNKIEESPSKLIGMRPWRSDLTIKLNQIALCPEESTNFEVSDSGNTCKSIKWSAETDQITLSVIQGSQYVSFYDKYTNQNFGTTITGLEKDINNYQLKYDNPNKTTSTDKKVILAATVNGNTVKDTLIVHSQLGNYFVNGEVVNYIQHIINNEKLTMQAWSEKGGTCGGNIESSDSTTYTAEIIQGSEYGELINPQNDSTGSYLSGIIAENDKINIKFYANGIEALTNEEIKVRISNSLENIQSLELSFIVVPSVVVVNFETEELSPGDTAKVIIRHRKIDGTLEFFPNNQDYEVQLLEGSNYGTILSSNGVDTSDYFDSVTGGIKFIADSNITVSSADVRLKVTTFYFGGYKAEKGGGIEHYKKYPQKFTEENEIKTNKKTKVFSERKGASKGGKNVNGITFMDPIYGIGKAKIKQANIELKILKPTEVTVDSFIFRTPEMPNLTVKAQLKNHNKGDFTFNWKYTISWTSSEPRTIRKIFEGTENGTNSTISSWTIPWNGSFIGGDIDTLTVTVNTNTKVYKKVIVNPFRILGKNPTIAAVKNELTLYQQVIVYKESSPKWQQFNAEGFPIWGTPHGYGIMQLDNLGTDNLGHTIRANAKQIWNWRDNIAAGKSLLSEKESMATTYVKNIQKKYPNAPSFTEEQIMQDIFRLYNGGHDWKWVPNHNTTGGKWVVIKWYNKDGTRNFYSEEAMEIYQNVLNNNPPAGWN